MPGHNDRAASESFRAGHAWVQDAAVEAVENIGGCASLSPDGISICILDKGHESPHGWELHA